MIENSSFSRGHLKERLFAEGLKERRCEQCGQTEVWRGRRMALILDHVNGVPNDHRIENLRVLCPNCAATLSTHCGRKNQRPNRFCGMCGVEFRPKRRQQRYCSRDCAQRVSTGKAGAGGRRKVVRPPYDQLLREIEMSSYLAVGRKYGVSGNAIRKWVQSYERHSQRKGNR